MPDKVLYTAEVVSTGDGRGGHVLSSDHRLDLDLSVPPELDGPGGPGTNPAAPSLRFGFPLTPDAPRF
jgi:lipoyl-dependent peroxiredoxin